ncbi:glycosyltransferase [Clostridium sp. MSJ-11]|uniref:Glycosyltransferase n=1 Tax=Clostridium mobile TaxID=2841512 RepID=A0ABS6EFV9_9CLOT|nr:glycosyltransferase [Clostridium mobile]MBU5483652.1 glycosyltransferase [Clostridium mobile]
MRILYCIRNDYLINFAGDSMQAIKYAEYLRKKGVIVDFNNGDIQDYSSYDIVHLFNLTRMGETYKYYKVGRLYNKPMVISPIYWNLKKYYKNIKDNESIKLWNKCNNYRFEILKGCKGIYPNSKLEGELLRKDFDKNIRYNVVYNGFDFQGDMGNIYDFKERYNLKNYILCVGRICNRKNQLALAKICNELNKPLVLIGSINDEKYYNECMKYDNVVYLGFMDSNNLRSAYRYAELHVLPSFIETPGLSSIEAVVNGCNIVTTSEGSAEEYFKDMAIYCNPYDEKTIKEGIEKGLKKTKSNILKDHILNNYNWEKCIDKLYESYMEIV